MLNNEKIFIYNLCFGLSKLYTVKTVHLYSAGPESKIGLSYVNVVCVYAGGATYWVFCSQYVKEIPVVVKHGGRKPVKIDEGLWKIVE